MRLIKIQALFLVSTECWTFGLEEFLIRNQGRSTTIQKFSGIFKSIELPVFQDRFQVQEYALGKLPLYNDEQTLDTEVLASVMAILWCSHAFMMVVELGQQELAGLSTDDIEAMRDGFGSELKTIFSKNITHPPQCLGVVHSFVEPSITLWSGRSSPPEWRHDIEKEVDFTFADVYRIEDDPHALLVVNPDTFYLPTHYLVVGDEENFVTAARELRNLFWYIGTRAISDKLIQKAETQSKEALSFRETLLQKPITPTITGLFASLHPRYRDPFEEVNDAILKVNCTSQTLTEITTQFASAYQVFRFDPWWCHGRFVLFDFYAARGHLVEIKRDEIGRLSLIDYLKRSALQTMGFYEQRLDQVRQDLAALMLSLQTMASVRTVQHGNILNKLILVLTLVSAGLALMQVLSSTNVWIGPSPALIGAFLILVFLLIVVAAHNKET